MGFFDRLSRVLKANLNDMVSKAEDPEKILEQAVADMGESLVELRQSIARAIAAQKKTEQQLKKNQTEASAWQKKAELAIQNGREDLAREALVRKKSFGDTATTLQQQVEQQNIQVKTLKQNLLTLESKIQEAKTKKDMLKARANAAKANVQLQDTMNNMDMSSAMSAFERMEDKIMELEAQSEATNVIEGASLDNEFAQLEASSSIDNELAMLKASMEEAPALEAASGTIPDTAAVSGESVDADKPIDDSDFAAVDAELEALRTQMKNI